MVPLINGQKMREKLADLLSKTSNGEKEKNENGGKNKNGNG